VLGRQQRGRPPGLGLVQRTVEGMRELRAPGEYRPAFIRAIEDPIARLRVRIGAAQERRHPTTDHRRPGQRFAQRHTACHGVHERNPARMLIGLERPQILIEEPGSMLRAQNHFGRGAHDTSSGRWTRRSTQSHGRARGNLARKRKHDLRACVLVHVQPRERGPRCRLPVDAGPRMDGAGERRGGHRETGRQQPQ
jgi:hypothetical protein